MKNVIGKIIIGIIVVALAVVLGIDAFSHVFLGKHAEDVLDHHHEAHTVLIGGVTVDVEVADTDSKRTLGLSGHAPLVENEGMLFVFEKEGKYGFWMKDMLFPIDMIWIGADKKIVYIKENTTPESYPEVYTPTTPALYVLEVNAGFSQKHAIKLGDPVSFAEEN